MATVISVQFGDVEESFVVPVRPSEPIQRVLDEVKSRIRASRWEPAIHPADADRIVSLHLERDGGPRLDMLDDAGMMLTENRCVVYAKLRGASRPEAEEELGADTDAGPYPSVKPPPFSEAEPTADITAPDAQILPSAPPAEPDSFVSASALPSRQGDVISLPHHDTHSLGYMPISSTQLTIFGDGGVNGPNSGGGVNFADVFDDGTSAGVGAGAFVFPGATTGIGNSNGACGGVKSGTGDGCVVRSGTGDGCVVKSGTEDGCVVKSGTGDGCIVRSTQKPEKEFRFKRVPHLSREQVAELKVGDFIDHRDAMGKFGAAEVIERREDSIKLHYLNWASKCGLWINVLDLQSHRDFAGLNSVSEEKQPSSGLPFGVGDFIMVRPMYYRKTRTVDWSLSEILIIDKMQIQVGILTASPDDIVHKRWMYAADINEVKQMDNDTSVAVQTDQNNEMTASTAPLYPKLPRSTWQGPCAQ